MLRRILLGLVTMDDLLAQIFGVLRDERTDLQTSLTDMKAMRTRTPVVGTPVRPTEERRRPALAEIVTRYGA